MCPKRRGIRNEWLLGRGSGKDSVLLGEGSKPGCNRSPEPNERRNGNCEPKITNNSGVDIKFLFLDHDTLI